MEREEQIFNYGNILATQYAITKKQNPIENTPAVKSV